MADPCDTLETLPVSVWARTSCKDGVCKTLSGRGSPPPSWMQDVIDTIAESEGLLFMRPLATVMKPRCSSNFGGRWFPQLNAIGVFEHSERKFMHGVVVHEMGHWLCWARGGDEPGDHAEMFYSLMEKLYPVFGVALDTAKRIEAVAPESWQKRQRW